MPTYVNLINWTDQGIRSYKESSKRAQAFTELVESMGGKVKEIVWTLGAYDLVAITEAPDDETVTAVSLKVSSLGNVRTTTLRGFNRKEFEAIVAKAG